VPERLLTGGLKLGRLTVAGGPDGVRQILQIIVCEVVQSARDRASQLRLQRFDSVAYHS